MTEGFDAYGGEPRGPTQLPDVRPEGSDIVINDDGTVDITLPDEQVGEPQDHWANLAEHLDPTRLDVIANDLLEAIELDKEARAERDKQYEEGLQRTGFGVPAPGGANFPGASRATHPLLAEASIDVAASIMKEMLPPEGPVKATVVGDDTEPKAERAKRVARYMNYQLTELMPSAYHEFETGFTQLPLGGAFYTKFYTENDQPQIAFIPIDHVYRPWSDGDFYSQSRITHRKSVDKWEFRRNVRSGLWLDVVPFEVATSAVPEETQADQANDRIIGKSETSENVDAIRLVYETSVIMGLEDDDADTLPYLVTIDVTARKVLSIYRNWAPDDAKRARLDFLIEWPFWPWRGGYPIGMTHMIGGLSVAATGSLRALMDAAMLNNSQTGVKLKGGATSGGQNLRPQVGETTEVQGSLSQDDIRKTYMPLAFPQPSAVLFQLLGFLVDAGRGMVRTTLDEMNQFNSNTPVGTAQMFLEQGMKNFGSVHGRLHRAMRRFLRNLYQINGRTLTNQKIIDEQGELTVSPSDFHGPMVVIPVSDPRIFSDMQRMAQAQTIVARSDAKPDLYDGRKAEENFLRRAGVADPDLYLKKVPKPTRQNAVAENVAASMGNPIQAYQGQDHEAHIQMHIAYLESPMFGSNPAVAPKFIPAILNHLAEHVVLWYGDAMLEGTTAALTKMEGAPVTLQSFMNEGSEAPLDRLMSEVDDIVIKHAQQNLAAVPQAIMKAQALLKQLAPPMPMDPTAVAAQDVQRQAQKDQMDGQAKVIDLHTRREKGMGELALKAQKQQADAAAQERDQELEAERIRVAEQANAVKADNNADDNETALQITGMKIAAGDAPGNLSTGTGIGEER
ncbi:MAG: hypothetical protein ACOY4R_27710 [Pseudomonadota bacterium]